MLALMLVVLLLLLLLLVLQLLVLGVLFLVLLLSELLSELLLVIGIMTVFRILTEHNLRGPDTAIELAVPVVLFRLSAAFSFNQVRFNLEFALSAAAAVPSLHASDNSKTECLCSVRFGVASLFIPCEIALRAKKTSNFGGPYFHLHRFP